MKKRHKEIIYIILAIIVIIISTTLAFFTWSSKKSELVLTIGSKDGTLVSLYPYELTGVLSTVSSSSSYTNLDCVEVTAENNTSSFSEINLFYDINSIDDSLVSSSVKYAITESSTKNGTYTEIKTGTLSSATANSKLTILSDELIPANTTQYYKVYLYIDGSTCDTSSLSNSTLNVSLNAEVTSFNVINKGTVSSETSNFLTSTLTLPRNQIETISINTSNTLPGSYLGSEDVSKDKDGSVMLWYLDSDSDNLYEVYIGSTNNKAIYLDSNSSYFFAFLTNLTSIDLSGLNTSYVTNMEYMFGSGGYEKGVLEEIIGLDNFDTSNVTVMNHMFYGCWKLSSLDVSSFDTSKVTNMNYMFYDCSSLITLNLSNFNTSSVERMQGMFQYCTNLTSLNLSNFNTSNVEIMRGMFYNCRGLTTLDLSSFNTSKVTDTSVMFSGDRILSVSNIDMRNADFSAVTTYDSMFYIPTSATIKLKDTSSNRTFMSNNFGSYTVTYIS